MCEPLMVPHLRVERPKTGYQDHIRRYRFLVDGVEHGQLKAGENLFLEVAAGTRDVQARIDWSGSPVLPVEVQPGATTNVIVTPTGALRGLFTTDGWVDNPD